MDEEEKREQNEVIEEIDESKIIDDRPPPTPVLRDTDLVKIVKEKIRSFTYIAKLFLILSFGVMALALLVGFINPEISLKFIEVILDKLAAVYLVIFGSLLGKKS